MSDDGCQGASAELSATQVKTLEEKLTDIYEEITNTQKEYDALMSDRAHKRAAKYGDECGNDEDLLVSPDSFFGNLSPSSSENNIDVAGDVGKETLEAALAGDVGKEVGCLEQNAGWLEQHYKEETEEETEEEPLTRRRPRRSATSDSTPPPTKRHVIADLDGHRMSWNTNGANGFRPCLRHSKVVKKNSGTVEVDPAFVEITCSDTLRFGANTCADVYRNADALIEARARVAAGAMTQGRFQNLEKVFGLKCAPRGVLVDPDLRDILDVVDGSVIDWVHTALQDGTFTIEATLLVQRVGATLGITFDDVAAFLQDGWNFPAWGRAKSSQLFRVFDPRRSPEENKVMASASELLR